MAVNVLYLHAHDAGRYVQPYGHAVPTPHLQRLAGEGVLFRRAFCTNPTCSPSRASLLTGQSAHACGALGLAHRGFALRDFSHTLPTVLRGAGYQTVLTGIQHIAAWEDAASIGYDVARAYPQPAPAEELAEAFLAGRPREPFFLDVGFFEPHRKGEGFDGPPPGEARTDARYVFPPAVLPDTPATRRDMAEFIDAARTMDAKMGRVLAALDASGLADRTLVIATTDHGIAFPGMKCNLTDHGLGVMLLMRGPAGSALRGGGAVDAMVSHLDVFPTVCEVTGVAPPGWLEGESLLPLARGERASLHEELFAEVNYHAAYEPMRAVRTEGHKYIRRMHDFATPVLPNCDDGASKALLLERGWRGEAQAREELYDLTVDPQERRNVASEARYAEVLTEMRDRLERWMRRTNDPILEGPIPLPPGGRANPMHGLSPNEPVEG